MKKQLSIIKQQGFTLIELLVVIGILGVLAAALIATIDPFEQLKKANDANVKNTTTEFVNANVRYYTTHNAMPWAAASLGAADCVDGAGGAPTNATLSDLPDCLDALVNDGELKAAFTTATSITKEIVVTGADKDIIACFKPQSKAEQRGTNTKFDSTGGTSISDCAALGGTNANTDCYWCIR
ncbi:prepilin-type N-terminal cleavage/methylation domain-containing protein [Patescibacteria group bacterium]|nr:prepilin-type N-terminal cleavage/methylation domain-containing protein [Patescibacteria group bacterium]